MHNMSLMTVNLVVTCRKCLFTLGGNVEGEMFVLEIILFTKNNLVITHFSILGGGGGGGMKESENFWRSFTP